jgi:hypothetical protein
MLAATPSRIDNAIKKFGWAKIWIIQEAIWGLQQEVDQLDQPV